MTVRELWEKYAVAKRAAKPKSWRIIAMRTRDTVAHFGDVEAMSLTVRAWCSFRDHRAVHGNSEGRPLSTPTLNYELDWLKAMLNWAVLEDLIPHNPLARARRMPHDSSRDTFLGEAELQKILAVCPPVLRAYVLAAFDTGLRKMELLTLRWPQIDARGFVSLPKTRTKTARRRMVKLSSRALEVMRALPHSDLGWVFPSPGQGRKGGGVDQATNQHYDARHISRMFRKACGQAGIVAAPGDGFVRVHDLRHSFATNAIRSGVPLQVVQRMTGHSTLAMLGRYLHAAESDIDSAVATMERARQPAPTEQVATLSPRDREAIGVLAGRVAAGSMSPRAAQAAVKRIGRRAARRAA